jgi:hypothetical protein
MPAKNGGAFEAMKRRLSGGRYVLPQSGGRVALADVFYYLHNFQTALAAIEARYSALLSAPERRFIFQFAALPQASRALLVRMIMRQGAYFRASRLNYPEIGETGLAVAPLLELGWVDAIPNLDIDQLERLCTKTELFEHFAMPRPYRTLTKPALVAVLRAQNSGVRPFHSWCRRSDDCVYELKDAPLHERFRLMFFGNFRQDWSEFVLSDLGVFTYEKVPASLLSPAFQTRLQIDSFQQLYQCRQKLETGAAPNEVLAAIPPRSDDCDWLEDRRQKLLLRIGRSLEKQGDLTAALSVLSTCTYRGARLRSIRLRERARDWQAARDLCLRAQLQPENEAERQQVERLLPRLHRKLGNPAAKQAAAPAVLSFALTLAAPSRDYAVEYHVRDSLAHQGHGNTTVHYVENGLVNSLFGLLCWKAIYAPIAGAFFHDFQYGPADLGSGRFFERRRGLFADCFAELKTDQYKATIRRNFSDKTGIQAPFVAWGLLNKRLLEWALRCFPAAHLRLWFEWMLRDIQENRAGFPDLVQFWPQERRYRLIEVKGPGDRLQDNQRRFLEFCSAHRMPVSVCYVRWAPADASTQLP